MRDECLNSDDAPEMNQENSHEYILIYSPDLVQVSSLLPSNRNRSYLVHHLIDSFGLRKRLKIVPPKLASLQDLEAYHSTDFLEFALNYEKYKSNYEINNESEFESLCEDDCPIFDKMDLYIKMIAGGTLTAARELISASITRKKQALPNTHNTTVSNQVNKNEIQNCIVVHWDGGRHHARKDEAVGFCYVNDIVLGILCLQEKFQKILYIDVDIHHGDGVQDAFYYTSKVFTVSFHRLDSGFFPGTGKMDEIGSGKGIHHNLNVPLRPGLTTKTMLKLYNEIIPHIIRVYQPEAIVLQCGADGLSRDPLSAQVSSDDFVANMVYNQDRQNHEDLNDYRETKRMKVEETKSPKILQTTSADDTIHQAIHNSSSTGDGWNLDISCFGEIIKTTKSFQVPLLILGGGGYHGPNVARCWAYCTSVIADREISTNCDIPDHRFFEHYAPDYSLQVDPSFVPDSNDDPEFISQLIGKAKRIVDKISKT